MAEALAAELTGFDAVIVSDPRPQDEPSPVRTAALAWQTARPDATHHLVLQDDLLVHPSLAEVLSSFRARGGPSAVISLYMSWSLRRGQAARFAALTGHSGVLLGGDRAVSPAICMPAGLAKEYAELLAGEAENGAPRRDTVILSAFLRKRGLRVICPLPTPVQHDARELPSILTPHSGLRRSVWYAGDEDAPNWRGPIAAVNGDLPFLTPACASHVSAFPAESVGATTLDWLTEHHLTRELVRAEYLETIHKRPDRQSRLAELVSPKLAFEAWITMFALGTLAWHHCGRHHSAVPHEPLASFLPGAAGDLLPHSALEKLKPVSADFLGEAFDCGLQVAGASGTRDVIECMDEL